MCTECEVCVRCKLGVSFVRVRYEVHRSHVMMYVRYICEVCGSQGGKGVDNKVCKQSIRCLCAKCEVCGLGVRCMWSRCMWAMCEVSVNCI